MIPALHVAEIGVAKQYNIAFCDGLRVLQATQRAVLDEASHHWQDPGTIACTVRHPVMQVHVLCKPLMTRHPRAVLSIVC